MTDDLFGAATALRRKSTPSKARPGRAGATGEAEYNAASIEVLEGLEPVRRRPGMYIGGTDDIAHAPPLRRGDRQRDGRGGRRPRDLHRSVARRGRAGCRVADNGRGMPVDPHPKFPGKSALEVIMTKLHAGGKFDSGVYETSGGLHGVGVSVVNALSDARRGRGRARPDALPPGLRARRAGRPSSRVVGKAPNRRGTRVRFRPDEQIFGKTARFDPARLFKMARSKAYLFGGVEIRWRCAPCARRPPKARSPPRRSSISPAA